jgi:Ala-tRNA(Pro) deacylase
MSSIKLKEFLKNNNIQYKTLMHAQVFTSQETAESAHISGREFAKTVMVKIDGKMAMAVLPASYNINLKLFQDSLRANSVELAHEDEFEDLFPECETGAMPPFGNLYGMEVYVCDEIDEEGNIAFNSGSHTELIRMSYKDFQRLVHPRKTHLTH